jgi:hypothetical protein
MRSREMADNFVGVHVGRGAAAGVVDVDGELVIVPALDHGFSRNLDVRPAIHLRCRTFDEAEGADERSRKALAADGEILNGPGRGRFIGSR